MPEEPLKFLVYSVGRNHSPCTGAAYTGTRPSQASVRGVCRKVSALTEAGYGIAARARGGGTPEPSAAPLGELLQSGLG